MTADDAYASIEAEFIGKPQITRSAKKGFAEGGLMTSGKLFAVRRQDDLLLKLPAGRVEALIATGKGAPFTLGAGRTMREWVLAQSEAADDWPRLAREAEAFVSGLEAENSG